eukprot:13970934-Alexandrium_andersonii.AAC.1
MTTATSSASAFLPRATAGHEPQPQPRRESGVWLGRRWGTAAHVVAVSPVSYTHLTLPTICSV